MPATADARSQMVETQIEARGVSHPLVLDAMRTVPREAFVPPDLASMAYEDTPLPIGAGQTISQPYIVAVMLSAIHPARDHRVLEIGTGSGYAAAVLSRIVREVYTVERHASLAREAERRFRSLGYGNVHVLVGDGTLGWPEHAPYDGIVVSAGGDRVPQPLLDQLAVDGRLIVPVGRTTSTQELVEVHRAGYDRYARRVLEPVQFVPLIGREGWSEHRAPAAPHPRHPPELIRWSHEPIDGIDHVALDPLLDRIGDAKVVLLGEASHGTSEFYRMRARMTRELIRRKGFSIVALEADWPDAARVDRYVRHRPAGSDTGHAFRRFPAWMWRNAEFAAFAEWLRAWNLGHSDAAVMLAGLDLYSLHSSIGAVLSYLDRVDPAAATIARDRYGCLMPWQQNPAEYGRQAVSGGYRTCEKPVVDMLTSLLGSRLEYSVRDGEQYFDAAQNARLVASAERYYRHMYYGSVASWNLRDQHMFETLERLLAHRGANARAVVWAHNSHIGDASATEMSDAGEFNIGQLCRERFGDGAYLIGFGTHHGTVAAADDWDGPMRIMRVEPSLGGSYERLCHDSGTPAFLLPLRTPHHDEVRTALLSPLLERAIGVIYRPRTERQSHYFEASLPRQFDEYCWFDETVAVGPLSGPSLTGEVPETYPFGV